MIHCHFKNMKGLHCNLLTYSTNLGFIYGLKILANFLFSLLEFANIITVKLIQSVLLVQSRILNLANFIQIWSQPLSIGDPIYSNIGLSSSFVSFPFSIQRSRFSSASNFIQLGLIISIEIVLKTYILLIYSILLV